MNFASGSLTTLKRSTWLESLSKLKNLRKISAQFTHFVRHVATTKMFTKNCHVFYESQFVLQLNTVDVAFTLLDCYVGLREA